MCKTTCRVTAGLRFTRSNHNTVEYAGVYCLRTNIKDWDDEKLWRTYITEVSLFLKVEF
ncbi:MAG: hypothetical protein R8M38_04415 [Mariprofundaceae bacterium]